jgi:hypothetical protein
MQRLACWVGRHRWTTRIDHGEGYRICEACGTTPRSRAFVRGGAQEIAGGLGFKLGALVVLAIPFIVALGIWYWVTN